MLFERKHVLLIVAVFLVAVLATIIAVIIAQPEAFDPLDPPAPSPSPAPADWMTPGRVAMHQSVVPVSQKKVPVRQIALPKPQQPELVQAMPDGGCLAIQTVTAAESGSAEGRMTGAGIGTGTGTGSPLVRLRMLHYRADGAILWDKTEPEAFAGFPVSVCVFANSGFAIGLQVQAAAAGSSGDFRYVGRLVRFGADGTRLWTAESGTTPAGSLDHLFALSDGSLLAAGAAEPALSSSVAEPATLAIQAQRFAASGQRLQQRTLALAVPGGASYTMLSGVSFSETAGLAIAWQTIPGGPVASGGPNGRLTHLAVLDANLGDKWALQLPEGVYISNLQALPDSLGILALGARQAANAAVTGSTGESGGTGAVALPAVFHFNLQGSLDWQHASDAADRWLVAATRTIDGQYIIGQYRVKADGSEISSLMAFSAQGADQRELAEIPGRIEQLVPAADGGFTAVLRQTVRQLPQPPYISSLWTDTEAIVCQFNRRLQLAWRRTIDQYKYALRNDLVVVTNRDRLLVG